MSTLQDRPNSALLVIDVQNDIVNGGHDRDAVVANIVSLVDRANADDVPVVWVQHSDDGIVHGSEGWHYVPELAAKVSDRLIQKTFADAFEDTNLEHVLSDLSVGRLLVVGAQTDECIRSTIHGAFVRGYDVTLVGDAHTTQDQTEWGAPTPEKVIAHTNLYWKYHTAPGRTADVVDSADVVFSDLN